MNERRDRSGTNSSSELQLSDQILPMANQFPVYSKETVKVPAIS